MKENARDREGEGHHTRKKLQPHVSKRLVNGLRVFGCGSLGGGKVSLYGRRNFGHFIDHNSIIYL
ncbi:hypothetical protein TSUD_305940 [Trifolium subterraneum]|uniref:Uncharacterized protein n=1 Tax=Trifolium subterraneum TaxID=3900 RepID=A0A2Z6LW19_TRISU|nr:hypothetical protein TSUD_305940 [Trifolium subterraneum]